MAGTGQRIVKVWSTREDLVTELEALAKALKKKTKVTVDRSKILNALIELLLASEKNIPITNIKSYESLREAMALAICYTQRRADARPDDRRKTD